MPNPGLCRIGWCECSHYCVPHYFVRHNQTEYSGASRALIPLEVVTAIALRAFVGTGPNAKRVFHLDASAVSALIAASFCGMAARSRAPGGKTHGLPVPLVTSRRPLNHSQRGGPLGPTSPQLMACGHTGVVSYITVMLHTSNKSPPAILNKEEKTWYRHSLSVHTPYIVYVRAL